MSEENEEYLEACKNGDLVEIACFFYFIFWSRYVVCLAARNHIHNMKLNNIVKIDGQDFFKSNGHSNSMLLMNPPYGKRIEFLINNVPNVDKAIISVHCHNDLGLAVSNSLSALDAGARQVECTVNGIG